MGVYLSTPEKTKHSEEGGSTFLEFGLSSMQGWRRSMEDSHIAQVDFDNTPNGPASLFAVFDGHGGPEVALFCKNFMLKELVQLEAFQQQNYELALKQVFHRIDQLLEDEENHQLLENYKQLTNPRGDTFETGSNEKENKGRRETMSIFEALKFLSGYINQPQSNSSNAQEEGETVEHEAKEHETDECDIEECEKGDNTNGLQLDSIFLNEKTDSCSKEIFSNALNLLSTDTSIEDDDELIPESKDESLHSTESTSETKPSDNKEINLTQVAKPEETKESLAKSNVEMKIAKQNSIKNNLSSFQDNDIDEELKIVFAEGDSSYCRLPDHRVQAGCTSVVALVCGEYLFIANAGDSRGVLCRNGQAIPMSFDHKPTSKIEYTRIRQAGGFVNSVGRVNGNLNLSRAIGDLKYKQIEHVSVEQQIITAEPDIEKFKISKDDEFFILACDGVWDCMTNEEIVDFVRERINKKKLHEIVEEILDFCLADDVRKTNGIGTDNMTCIIVQFHHNNYM